MKIIAAALLLASSQAVRFTDYKLTQDDDQVQQDIYASFDKLDKENNNFINNYHETIRLATNNVKMGDLGRMKAQLSLSEAKQLAHMVNCNVEKQSTDIKKVLSMLDEKSGNVNVK